MTDFINILDSLILIKKLKKQELKTQELLYNRLI